ncbi:MAG TPA: HAD family phosphatase [Micromonosporaceae bacterium]|jgi:putative hydrolase of the HAD superfamily
MTIKAVIFDIGGVFELTEPMDFDKRWESSLGLPPDTIWGPATQHIWSAGRFGSMTEAEVRAALIDALGLPAVQVDGILETMWEQYLGSPNLQLIDYARALRPTYRLGILSNSFSGAREREQALIDLVDDVVYSHEVGCAKPDPKIFAMSCERLGVAPSDAVFIDDVPANVEAASAYGLHAILFGTTAQVIADVDRLLAD